MADYRPLIERLVSGLPCHDTEARASAYQRARKVLEDQFEGDLSIDDDRHFRETAALEGAISAVEAELALSQAPFSGGTRNDPEAQEMSAPVERAGLPFSTRSASDRTPFVEKANPSNIRKPRQGRWPTMAAGGLGLLLIVAGAAIWQGIRNHDRSPLLPGIDIEDADRETTGVNVPSPIGQTSLADNLAVSTSTVLQRAALLVAAPREPQGLRTYVGTVTWRLSRIAPSSEHPAIVEIHADIDISEAKLKIEVTFDRNLDPQLSASHTVEVRFVPQPGNLLGAVEQIKVIEMRDDDVPTGVRLSGTQAKITDNNFLIGLSRGSAETENLRLIEARPWLDLPVLFVGHRVAKLTFEKGTVGQTLWAEALRDWSQTTADARSSMSNSRR